jgi:hypothetical protein
MFQVEGVPGIEGLTVELEEGAAKWLSVWLRLFFPSSQADPVAVLEAAFAAAQKAGFGIEAELSVEGSPYDSCALSWEGERLAVSLWVGDDPDGPDIRLYWRLQVGGPPRIVIDGVSTQGRRPRLKRRRPGARSGGPAGQS